MEQRVERPVADGGAQDDVGERGLLRGAEDAAVLGKEPVEVRPDRARGRERVTGGQAGVADQREAVAEIVGQLVKVVAPSGRCLLDVAAPALRRRRLGRACPDVDELHLEEGSRGRDRGDHALLLAEPHLDRQADPVAGLARVHVRRDPFAVAEPEDRLARDGLVARILLQLGVVDRADDDVLDVVQRDQARALRVRRRVDRVTGGAEGAGLGFAGLEPAVHAVDGDRDALQSRLQHRAGLYLACAAGGRQHVDLTHAFDPLVGMLAPEIPGSASICRA